MLTPDWSQNDSQDPVQTTASTPTQDSQTAHEAADSTCPHLLQLWKDSEQAEEFRKKFKAAALWGIAGNRSIKQGAKKRRLGAPTCSECNMVLSRPHVCMHCSFAGCWRSEHMKDHLHSAGHCFALDIKSVAVYCFQCEDYTYSRILDGIFRDLSVAAAGKQVRFKDPKSIRETYVEWTPSKEDQDNSSKTAIKPVFCGGRRGLLNLGQTCAMNTVLQAFAHNPLLRNYFLSDKHNAQLCQKRDKDCMCCEMDKFFSEIHSEAATPYGPLSFLPVLWRSSSSSSLAEGYAQHDAHEIFITCLSQIHATSKGSTNVSCNCVIHSTFAGWLSSEVKCGKASCEHKSVKIDPMMDISLELRSKDKGGKEKENENTLAACLRRFTQAEKLLPKEYTCSKCGSSSLHICQGSTKCLSISKLPPVLAFQLKRFGHNAKDKSTAQKINTRIRFPTQVNMFPYTSMATKTSIDVGSDILYLYDLFCVINHEGGLDNGHYTNFARFGDEWYRFDDDKVTLATQQQVLASTAYLLFYVKRNLDYKPNVRPSYIVKRETEVLMEKQREREKELKLSQEIDDELMSIL